MCLGSIYKSTLENGLEYDFLLTDAVKLPSKAQCVWPLERKGQYELSAKNAANENILVTDLFKYD